MLTKLCSSYAAQQRLLSSAVFVLVYLLALILGPVAFVLFSKVEG